MSPAPVVSKSSASAVAWVRSHWRRLRTGPGRSPWCARSGPCSEARPSSRRAASCGRRRASARLSVWPQAVLLPKRPGPYQVASCAGIELTIASVVARLTTPSARGPRRLEGATAPSVESSNSSARSGSRSLGLEDPVERLDIGAAVADLERALAELGAGHPWGSPPGRAGPAPVPVPVPPLPSMPPEEADAWALTRPATIATTAMTTAHRATRSGRSLSGRVGPRPTVFSCRRAARGLSLRPSLSIAYGVS